MAATYDTDVVIIGGGPVGLALAAELGWRGQRCILLEQTDGAVLHPKMDGIDLRVMEFCRRWGIIEQMREYAFPPDYPQDMVYVTSLDGYELGRESFA
ncbi:MAG: FAD-dependent monooxygenase, partial [Candidimonas sp.]